MTYQEEGPAREDRPVDRHYAAERRDKGYATSYRTSRGFTILCPAHGSRSQALCTCADYSDTVGAER